VWFPIIKPFLTAVIATSGNLLIFSPIKNSIAEIALLSRYSIYLAVFSEGPSSMVRYVIFAIITFQKTG
jgi:hypothetical protein